MKSQRTRGCFLLLLCAWCPRPTSAFFLHSRAFNNGLRPYCSYHDGILRHGSGNLQSLRLTATPAEGGTAKPATAQDHQMSIRRENRLAVLGDMTNRSSAQEKELEGLLAKASAFEEQYKPLDFTASHRNFKDGHNRAFAALCNFCRPASDDEDEDDAGDTNIFFLDGPDAGTATALQAAGFATSQMYVANRHKSSCAALVEWGMPPDHVAHQSAHLALAKTATKDGHHKSAAGTGSSAGQFSEVDFGAYYFDGCGGYAPMFVEMLDAALDGREPRKTPIAVGLSVLGGGRDVVDKEQGIVQHLVVLAKRMQMRVSHVLDEPARYGVEQSLCKVEGSTLTSWFVLEPANHPER